MSSSSPTGDPPVTHSTQYYDPNGNPIYTTGTINVTGAGGFVYNTAPVLTAAGGFGVTGNHSHTQYTITSTGAYVDFNTMQTRIDNLEKILTRLNEEHELRKKYPALDHAYEQYEVMMEICKAKEADDAAGENSK